MNSIRLTVLIALLTLPAGSAIGQSASDRKPDRPPGVVRQFGSSRLRHQGFIRALDRSGTLLASGSSNGVVKVWDLYTGELKYRLIDVQTRIRAVSFSPDGNTLAVTSESRWSIWRVRDGKRLHTSSPDPVVGEVTYSPDGSLLAIGVKDRVILWSVENEAIVRSITGVRGIVRSLSFTPDGTKLVSAGDENRIRLWRVKNGTQIRTFEAAGRRVRSVDVSPDGTRLVSSGGGGRMTLWHLESGKKIRALKGHDRSVRTVAFSPDGRRIASGSHDRTVRLWNPDSGKNTATFSGHPYGVEALAYGPDGTTLAAASKQVISFWNTTSKKRIIKGSAHGAPVQAVAFSPDGRLLVTGSEDRTVKLWNIENGALRTTLTGHEGTVRDVQFTPDGRHVVSSGNDGSVRVWNVLSGSMKQSLSGHDKTVHAIDVSPDGRFIVSGGERGTLRVWSLSSGKSLQTIRTKPPQRIHAIEFSPNGNTLVSGGYQDLLRRWEVRKQDGAITLQKQNALRMNEAIYDLTFFPDGKRLAVALADGSTRIYNPATGANQSLVHRDSLWDYSTDVSPDGSLLASGDFANRKTGRIDLYSVLSAKRIHTFEHDRGNVLDLAFSPDSRYLAVGLNHANPVLYAMDPATWETDLPLSDPSDLTVRELLSKIDRDQPLLTLQVRSELVRRGKRSVRTIRRLLLEEMNVWMTAEKRKKMKKLVRKLGHEAYDVRTKAHKRLLVFLEEHLPRWSNLIHAVAPVKNPEIRHRLRIIHRQIIEKLGSDGPSALDLYAVEVGIQALRQIGTTSARKLLRQVAESANGTPVGNSASRALNAGQ